MRLTTSSLIQVICMIALGILDNAFELEFDRAEDIFKARLVLMSPLENPE